MIETYFKVVIDEETEAENIQSKNGEIYTEISEMCDKLNQLSKENEQLKQEKQELFDFFMNEYDRQEDESIDREIKLEEHIKSLIDVNEQLKKEKKAIQQENLSMIDFMNANFDEHMTQEKLNRRIIELTNENKELKKDLEYWKSNCLSYTNQNSILWNEISILQKQGAKTSASFEEYVDSISTEHTRYWKRKLNKAKKDGVIE